MPQIQTTVKTVSRRYDQEPVLTHTVRVFRNRVAQLVMTDVHATQMGIT